MRTYLATSRDGVHFDLEWVYAEQELVPHGECRPPPYCHAPGRRNPSADNLFEAGNPEDSIPLDELCCPFDHSITIPASQLLTVRGEHKMYYEGRSAFHENRYAKRLPGGIARRLIGGILFP